MYSLQIQSNIQPQRKNISSVEKKHVVESVCVMVGCMIGFFSIFPILDHLPSSVNYYIDKGFIVTDRVANKSGLMFARVLKASSRLAFLAVPVIVGGNIGLEVGKRLGKQEK